MNGVIEFDNAYFGSPAVNKSRAGAQKRRKFLWYCLWMREVIPAFWKCEWRLISSKESVRKYASAAVADGNVIRNDGYRSYIPALEGYAHEHISYNPDSNILHWLHIAISNAKASILGTYNGLPKKTFRPIWTSILSVSVAVTLAGLSKSFDSACSSLLFGWPKWIISYCHYIIILFAIQVHTFVVMSENSNTVFMTICITFQISATLAETKLSITNGVSMDALICSRNLFALFHCPRKFVL